MTDRKTPSEARKAAGARIDPETAEVWFNYARILDPYNGGLDVPEDAVGRQWFAADPDERIAVHFSDLPETTCRQLQQKVYGKSAKNPFTLD
jgi:hypothetical protein